MTIVEFDLRPRYPVAPPTTFDTSNPWVRLANRLHLDDSVRRQRDYDYAEHRFYENWHRLLLPLTHDWVQAAIVRTKYHPDEITIFWRWMVDGREYGARFALNNRIFAHNPESIIAIFHRAVGHYLQKSMTAPEEAP